MSILAPFEQARVTLGLASLGSIEALEEAYARLSKAHPPDQDPDGHRRIREAYELLLHPVEKATAMLEQKAPLTPPPALPDVPPAPRGAAAIAVLRAMAAGLEADALEG